MLLNKLQKKKKQEKEFSRKELVLDLDHFTDELQKGRPPDPAGLYAKYPTFSKEIDLQVNTIRLLEEWRQYRASRCNSDIG